MAPVDFFEFGFQPLLRRKMMMERITSTMMKTAMRILSWEGSIFGKGSLELAKKVEMTRTR